MTFKQYREDIEYLKSWHDQDTRFTDRLARIEQFVDKLLEGNLSVEYDVEPEVEPEVEPVSEHTTDLDKTELPQIANTSNAFTSEPKQAASKTTPKKTPAKTRKPSKK
jgi:hypothetical protein